MVSLFFSQYSTKFAKYPWFGQPKYGRSDDDNNDSEVSIRLVTDSALIHVSIKHQQRCTTWVHTADQLQLHCYNLPETVLFIFKTMSWNVWKYSVKQNWGGTECCYLCGCLTAKLQQKLIRREIYRRPLSIVVTVFRCALNRAHNELYFINIVGEKSWTSIFVAVFNDLTRLTTRVCNYCFLRIACDFSRRLD